MTSARHGLLSRMPYIRGIEGVAIDLQKTRVRVDTLYYLGTFYMESTQGTLYLFKKLIVGNSCIEPITQEENLGIVVH